MNTATEMEDSECWLPSDFLDDDYLGSMTRQMAKIRINDPLRGPAKEALIQQQLRVAHFYQLKQQQLIKQQYEFRKAQCRSRRDYEAAWPPLLKQQDYYHYQQQHRQQRDQSGSGMRAVFLNGAGSRRDSAGTGVFLPRGAGAPDEPKKEKPSCFTVLLPARVVQALNLNLPQTGYGYGYVLDHDIVMANLAKRSTDKNHHHHQQAAAASHEIRLPPEWTY